MFERIQKIMEYEKLNSKEFAEEVGINPSSLSHYFSGTRSPSLDVLNRILTRFEHINTDWLLFGKGIMLKSNANQTSIQLPKIDKRQLNLFDDTNVKSTEINESKPDHKSVPEKNEEDTTLQPSAEIRIPVNKKIIKLVIFYSDNTFETFMPDASKELF